MRDCNQIDPSAIESALAGTPFARGLHHFATIGSTNTHALEQARTDPAEGGAPHGSFYVADEQSAGRGRSDHHWHSASGAGLYLSVLLRPQIPIADLVWLPLLAGLATHRAIQQVIGLEQDQIDLRWPNDILIGPRKVAGILVEAQTDSNRVTAAVVGIGINLHQRAFPPDLATPATSLDLETGLTVSRQHLLIALLQSLHTEIAALDSAPSRAATFAAIPDRIEAISSWVRGRRVQVHGPQQLFGETAGLNAKGFLRLRTSEGLVTITTGGLRDPGAP